MTHNTYKYVLMFCLAVAGWVWNGDICPVSHGDLTATAAAFVGRPRTPVSYAGVARRSTVGAGAPGVGVSHGVGAGAPGVGVTHGVGAGARGAGVAPGNRGGPVNRVRVR